jgi:hypothetical protein
MEVMNTTIELLNVTMELNNVTIEVNNNASMGLKNDTIT